MKTSSALLSLLTSFVLAGCSGSDGAATGATGDPERSERGGGGAPAGREVRKDPSVLDALGGALGGGGQGQADGGQQVDEQVARQVAEKQQRAADDLQAAPTFSQTFRHPSGAYFLYPDGWTVRDTGDGTLAVEPPDIAQIDGQRAEVLALAGEATKVERVDDPEVKQFAQQFVTASFPFLKAHGEPKVVKVGPHDVLELQWRGDYSGNAMAAAFQVLLLDDFAIAAFTFAPQDRFPRRLQTMTEVVKTVGYERPKADPRLVGSWRYEKTYISGSFSSITVRNLVLRADGVCLEGGKMMFGMEHSDAYGNNIGSSSGDSGNAEYRGRWHTEGNQLVLVWENADPERWGFYIEGRSMLWKSGEARKLWERTD